MISERRVHDIVDTLSDRERTTRWSAASFDHGALSCFGESAWVPSDPTNVTIMVGNRLVVIRGVSPNIFLPTWVRPTIEAILPILKLRQDWDRAGGRPIDPQLVKSAIGVLSGIMEYNSIPPSVVPTSVGGIQFEWHVGGVDLEINIPPTGDAVFEFEGPNEEVEGRLPENVGVLASLISRLHR